MDVVKVTRTAMLNYELYEVSFDSAYSVRQNTTELKETVTLLAPTQASTPMEAH